MKRRRGRKGCGEERLEELKEGKEREGELKEEEMRKGRRES